MFYFWGVQYECAHYFDRACLCEMINRRMQKIILRHLLETEWADYDEMFQPLEDNSKALFRRLFCMGSGSREIYKGAIFPETPGKYTILSYYYNKHDILTHNYGEMTLLVNCDCNNIRASNFTIEYISIYTPKKIKYGHLTLCSINLSSVCSGNVCFRVFDRNNEYVSNLIEYKLE